ISVYELRKQATEYCEENSSLTAREARPPGTAPLTVQLPTVTPESVNHRGVLDTECVMGSGTPMLSDLRSPWRSKRSASFGPHDPTCASPRLSDMNQP